MTVLTEISNSLEKNQQKNRQIAWENILTCASVRKCQHNAILAWKRGVPSEGCWQFQSGFAWPQEVPSSLHASDSSLGRWSSPSSVVPLPPPLWMWGWGFSQATTLGPWLYMWAYWGGLSVEGKAAGVLLGACSLEEASLLMGLVLTQDMFSLLLSLTSLNNSTLMCRRDLWLI